MADTKISALTAASALDGTEVAPVVQSGTTKKATVDQYKTYINNGTALVDIQTNVNAAQALLASSGSAITAGQGYILDNGGVTQLPTGISLMRLVGINLPAGAKGFGYAEAYITALATFVPCVYDVANNVARFDYLLWAGHLTQAGTNAPTIDATSYNISGETPTLAYDALGNYGILFTGNKLVSADAVKHFSFIYDTELQGFYTIEGASTTGAVIKSARNGAFDDNRLDHAYIEIRLVYTL